MKKIKRGIYAFALRHKARKEAAKAFRYDRKIFSKHAGALNTPDLSSARAEIIMAYHVIEKGLTMPDSRPGFGINALKRLINLVSAFEARFGRDPQVEHAAKVVKTYAQRNKFTEGQFPELENFLASHNELECAIEPHITKDEFFANNEAPFPLFASSRHMVRHFGGSIPRERLQKAIDIALTAPSACNRQPTRIHIVESRPAIEKLLALQGGSRGFGSSADKLLVVTSTLSCIRWGWERHEAYTNGGIFAMNLAYALHYCKIAHCILHWGVCPEADVAAHKIVPIPEDEAIVLLIACAMPRDEFDIAASPRLKSEDVATWHN